MILNMCTSFGFDPVSVWSLTTGGSCCGPIRGVKRSSVPRSALNLCLLYYHLRSCQMCKCDLSPRKSLLMNPTSPPPAPARNPATGCVKRNSCKLNVFLLKVRANLQPFCQCRVQRAPVLTRIMREIKLWAQTFAKFFFFFLTDVDKN